MKSLIKNAFLPVIIFVTGSAFSYHFMHTVVYKVNPAQSTVEWQGDKIGGSHKGLIKISSGEIKYNHGRFSGEVVIDMSSINNTDLEGKSKTKLENFLKSANFFDVEKYPSSKFTINTIIPDNKNPDSYTVTGTLNIKNKSNQISFPAIIEVEDEIISCKGTAIIDRTKFDIHYGSKSIFPDIGDKMIYDDIKLKFSLIANSQ